MISRKFFSLLFALSFQAYGENEFSKGVSEGTWASSDNAIPDDLPAVFPPRGLPPYGVWLPFTANKSAATQLVEKTSEVLRQAADRAKIAGDTAQEQRLISLSAPQNAEKLLGAFLAVQNAPLFGITTEASEAPSQIVKDEEAAGAIKKLAEALKEDQTVHEIVKPELRSFHTLASPIDTLTRYVIQGFEDLVRKYPTIGWIAGRVPGFNM